MPIPTQSSTPDAVASNAPASSKSRKSKASKKAVAAPKAATPREILFELPANPYETPIPPYIWIDHPQERERLLGPVYVVRMGVGGAQQVEMSVDNGPWQPCRLTSGYYWYDWSGIQPGKHTLVARIQADDGRWFRTPPRNCDYRP